MKKLFAIFSFLLLATFSFAQKSGAKISFSTKDFNGNTITDSVFSENNLTMLNIWGTFCPPCIREMPDLAKLNEANKSKGVRVIGIPLDIVDQNGNILARTKAKGDVIIEQTGANYTHLIPTDSMMKTFLKNIQAVPATIFVDKNGNQVGSMYLGARSQKDWQKIIDNLLKNQK